MDLLSQALRTIHLDRLEAHAIESYGSWGSRIPLIDAATSSLFVVMEGDVWVDAEGRGGAARVHYSHGDVGLLLPGHTFIARDALTTTPRPDPMLGVRIEGSVIRYGDEGPRTLIHSIGFRLHAGAVAPLLEALSPASQVPAAGGAQPGRLAAAFGALFNELDGRRPGAYAASERWAEAILLEVLCAQIAREDAHHGAREDALADPPIAAALAFIHRDPAPWTVDLLAARVSLSRSSFTARFAERVGEPPARYLTRCRLERALRLLQATKLPLHEIARRVGYAEVASFHRAFKRWTGRRPGELRSLADGCPRPLYRPSSQGGGG